MQYGARGDSLIGVARKRLVPDISNAAATLIPAGTLSGWSLNVRLTVCVDLTSLTIG
ncbi:hypothetical protein D3C75_1333340 [compost metagenome]